MDHHQLGALLVFALMSATETARIPFGSLIQSNRTFILLNTPQLPGEIFKLSCLSPNEVATLDSRDMQLHLVTEANRTQYSHVTTWITLDRSLTRYDSLVYINGSVVADDVTESNSMDLLCVSLNIKEGGTATYQTEACSRHHSFICRTENTTADAGICLSGVCFIGVISNSTWFDARYRCITEYSGDLAVPPQAILSFPNLLFGSHDRTFWVAAASEDSMAAYGKWQPGQDTPSYDCVLLSLARGNWTAVSCDQTNDFVLCEKETFNNLATTTSTLVSTTHIEDNESTSTPSATTKQATTPLITTMEITTPPATTMELTTSPATTKELTTPAATTMEITTPSATTSESTTPYISTMESSTRQITTLESTTPQITTMQATTHEITTMESTAPPVTTAESTTKPLASASESTTRPIATTESTEHRITTQILTNESSSSSLTTTESTKPSTAESTAESTTEPAADNSTGEGASSDVTRASAADINSTIDPTPPTEKTVVIISGDDSNLTLIIGVAVACTVVYVIIVVLIAVCCYRRITAKRTRGDRDSSTASLAPLDNATPRNVSRNPSFRFTEAAVRTSFDGDAVNRDKYLSLEQSGGFGRVAAPSVMSDFTDLYAVYPKENTTAYGEEPTAIDEDCDDESDSELPDDFMDFSEFADPLYNTVPAHSNNAKPSAPTENIPHYSNTLDTSSPMYANLEMTRRNGGALRTESFKEGPKGGIYALPMRRPENMQNRDSAMTTIL